MKLRPYDKSDAEDLAHVYRDAANFIGRQAYNADQVRVWSLYPDDIEEFRDRLARGLTLVAEADNVVVAFGQLDPGDHVAFIYCASANARRGIASAIYDRLEAHAIAKGILTLTTDASRISRPFFEKKGFTVTAIEHSLRLGVLFERFRMSKPLSDQTVSHHS